jgi:hypothetical protein
MKNVHVLRNMGKLIVTTKQVRRENNKQKWWTGKGPMQKAWWSYGGWALLQHTLTSTMGSNSTTFANVAPVVHSSARQPDGKGREGLIIRRMKFKGKGWKLSVKRYPLTSPRLTKGPLHTRARGRAHEIVIVHPHLLVRATTLNMIFSVWLYLVLSPPYPAQHWFSIIW